MAHDTMDMVYKAVGQIHNDIFREDRAMLIQQLEAALSQYEHEALRLHAVRVHLYNVYNNKIKKEQAVSTFSREFNMSIQGHNAELGDKVEALMIKAFNFDKEGKGEQAVQVFQQLKLRHSIIYGPRVLAICKACAGGKNPHAQRAADQMRWITKYQDALFRSVIKLATGLGKKAYAALSGDVISEEDLVHEAILATKEAVASYRPCEEGRTFTSFVNNWVSGVLSKYLNENTRTVAVPRSVIDRARPVLEAVEQIGQGDLISLAALATKILFEKKQNSRGVKLRREEVYSPEEVNELLTVTQDIQSLDVEITEEESSHPVAVIELLETDELTQDQLYDKKTVTKRLMRIMNDFCKTQDEFTIMEIRWGNGKVRGLKQSADLFRKRTGHPMNKGKVAEIERRVLERARKASKAGDNRLFEIQEVLAL